MKTKTAKKIASSSPPGFLLNMKKGRKQVERKEDRFGRNMSR